jgi:pimeloyl-ACP methyl ester carboxylesterase
MNLDVEGRRAARSSIPSVEAAAERLVRANPRLAPEIARELAGTFTEPAPDGGVVWKVDPLHRTQAPKPFLKSEIEPMWRALTMPVLSVYGTESPWIPEDLDYRHSCLPNARVVKVEGAGHNVHHDRPSVVADLVTEWMTA